MFESSDSMGGSNFQTKRKWRAGLLDHRSDPRPSKLQKLIRPDCTPISIAISSIPGLVPPPPENFCVAKWDVTQKHIQEMCDNIFRYYESKIRGTILQLDQDNIGKHQIIIQDLLRQA